MHTNITHCTLALASARALSLFPSLTSSQLCSEMHYKLSFIHRRQPTKHMESGRSGRSPGIRLFGVDGVCCTDSWSPGETGCNHQFVHGLQAWSSSSVGVAFNAVQFGRVNDVWDWVLHVGTGGSTENSRISAAVMSCSFLS